MPEKWALKNGYAVHTQSNGCVNKNLQPEGLYDSISELWENCLSHI